METVNITVRVDKDIKMAFDEFCDNVGMNVSTAINMFLRATLLERRLPFTISDPDPKAQARKNMKAALRALQEESIKNGTDKTTMEEIIADIKEYRQEKRAKNA